MVSLAALLQSPCQRSCAGASSHISVHMQALSCPPRKCTSQVAGVSRAHDRIAGRS